MRDGELICRQRLHRFEGKAGRGIAVALNRISYSAHLLYLLAYLGSSVDSSANIGAVTAVTEGEARKLYDATQFEWRVGCP